MLSKQDTSRLLKEAQENGWTFDPDIVKKLESYINGVSDESKKLGNLKRIKNAVDDTAEDTGSLYMAWLVYTAQTHPTFDTADPYIHVSVDGHHMALLSTAKQVEGYACASSAIFALMAAGHGYSRLTNLDHYFTPQTEAIVRRHSKYFEGSATLPE